ncbi:MAG TPA: alkaline phosphatase family protein [Candidatus Babeliales bacterium]|nr:alkaline phosphatase family protein [Candidatus Babeliales bacterium]
MSSRFGVARGLAAINIAVCLAACGAGSPTAPSVGLAPLQSGHPVRRDSSTYITHVVVVIQENRSFDDLFATFSGADGATEGLMETPSGDVKVALKEVNLFEYCDFAHGYLGFLRNYDGGKMDGFALNGGKCSGDHTEPYQYVNPAQIAQYWTLAQQYVLADHMFQTQGSGSFTAHQDLIRGGTMLNPQQTISLVDYPTATPWGCDAPSGTLTSLLKYADSRLYYRYDGGPFPCLTYSTLRDLLDAKSVSWKYYSPAVIDGPGALWNAFDAIKAVRYGPEWNENVTQTPTQIFSDIAGGQLPAVSWVIPDRENSDHPGPGSGDTGPSWVASIVNAIGESQYWPNAAIVILWDDWGGFYDNVPPPFFDHWGGLGFRVPMIVVSPYARETYPSKPGYIDHTQYEFASVLKFIEDTFGLGRLGTTDRRAKSIAGSFDFSQAPRAFKSIPLKYSKSFFLHQRPSHQPVDTQ